MAESVTPQTPRDALLDYFKEADADEALDALTAAGFRIVPPGWDVVRLQPWENGYCTVEERFTDVGDPAFSAPFQEGGGSGESQHAADGFPTISTERFDG